MTYSAVLLSVVLAFILFALGFATPTIRRNGLPLRKAPNSLPFIGNGLLFLQDRHKLLAWFAKCERIFGLETFAIRVPSLPPGVVINDPKNLEFVLKNEDIFSKGDFFKRRSWDLFGNGIINADGELWRVQRKAGLHFLSGSNMKVLIDVALPKYLEDTLSTLKSCDGSQIDLEAVFHELTTQLMGRMAYDMDMHADDSFTKAFEYASGATGERFQNPLWQITESFTGARFRRAVSEVKQFGKEIVKNALCKTSKADSEFETSGSLISSLLDSIDDHEMVADAALNYLSAGRDTTAQALTWTLDQLMRNPDGIAKIRQEEGHTVTSRPYTLAAFYEGLRLFPPVPFEIKQCQQATILPDGTALPKNAIVFWSIWAMGRSNNWGDGNTFRPERWLVDGKFVAKSAFEFPVFNGGPRMCLGKKMAESIAAMVIARLLEEFDFVAVGDGSARKSKNSLTLPMEGGLPCIVKARPSQKRACI